MLNLVGLMLGHVWNLKHCGSTLNEPKSIHVMPLKCGFKNFRFQSWSWSGPDEEDRQSEKDNLRSDGIVVRMETKVDKDDGWLSKMEGMISKRNWRCIIDELGWVVITVVVGAQVMISGNSDVDVVIWSGWRLMGIWTIIAWSKSSGGFQRGRVDRKVLGVSEWLSMNRVIDVGSDSIGRCC